MNHLRLAFIAPRLPSGDSVGGAETLIKHHAMLSIELGHEVSFLTTCATDHFSWKNDIEPGKKNVDGLEVHMFPVDEKRDIDTFLTIQEKLMKRQPISAEEEQLWLDNGVNSTAMVRHLEAHSDEYDLIIAGPYLFGLTVNALQACPEKAVLLPCLHDEPFARLEVFRNLLTSVKGIIFNTAPEMKLAKDIARGTLPENKTVGFSISPIELDREKFKNSLPPLSNPYVIYCGRREPMKGTPLLLDYMRTFKKRTGSDISLILTGKGPLELEAGDSDWVYDAGFLSEADKLSAMAGAAAFCHPSTYESLGIVILESWMAGTPCLVHAGSAVLKDQCSRSNGGMWFRCYPDFEEELKTLLDNPQLRSMLADNGKTFVEKEYSRQATAERLNDIICRLVPAPGRPR